MAVGQMLKILPENILMNISSFMLGKPEQMRLHNNKALREIQRKNKIEITMLDEKVELKKVSYAFNGEIIEKEGIRNQEVEYGYKIKCINCKDKKAMRIMNKQTELIMELFKDKGETNMIVFFDFKTKMFNYSKTFFLYNVEECDDKDLKQTIEQETEQMLESGFQGGTLKEIRIKIESHKCVTI